MIKHKWTVNLRNKLSVLATECDSCAAIDGALLTDAERKYIQNALFEVVKYIDLKIYH